MLSFHLVYENNVRQKVREREGAKAARDRFGKVTQGLRPKQPRELFQINHRFRDILDYIGTQMLVIDEVHTLLASTDRQQRILLNTLRYLANELRILLICAGTADARIR